MNAAIRSPQPPLTRSVEDYLKSVFHLTSQGGFATTSDIAAMLEVAPPSVSGMMKRLSETGLIEHVPYRGVQLTPQGRRAALQMIRRHRILESYLTSKLGDPQYDPHGAPIPTAAGEIEEAELVTLAETAVGSSVVLREVGDENTERLHYLAEQGLIPGVHLTVIDRQPFNGPTIVRLGDGTTRVVGQELALLLLCRPGEADGE